MKLLLLAPLLLTGCYTEPTRPSGIYVPAAREASTLSISTGDAGRASVSVSEKSITITAEGPTTITLTR